MSSDTNFDTQLDCRCCDRTELIDGDVSRNEETNVGDWQYISDPGIDADEGEYFTYSATCPSCIARAADGAVQSARESGLVACLHPDHGSHVPGSEVFDTCREAGHLPLSDEEYKRVMAAYHDARERCCPACGRAGALREITVEYQGFTLNGRECGCGWSGRQTELSYRKPTDSDSHAVTGTVGSR